MADIVSDNVVHAIAGAGGGMISMALTYPLVTVSTRSQVDNKKGSQIQTILKIFKEEGVMGFYSGIESGLSKH